VLHLGIDQHHKQLTISIGNDGGTVILKRQVSTRPDKTRAFLDDVRRQAGDDGFMAWLEVCGFNDWLIALLHEYGCREVVLIHPQKRSRRKTDRRDASKLSELLWINGERLRNGRKPEGLRRVVIPSADDQADRQLTALRKRVGQQRTRSINKMKNRRGRLIKLRPNFHRVTFLLTSKCGRQTARAAQAAQLRPNPQSGPQQPTQNRSSANETSSKKQQTPAPACAVEGAQRNFQETS
jgi:transposase